MKFAAGIALVIFVCFVREGQANNGVTPSPSDMAAKFLSLVSSSSTSLNLYMVNSSLSSLTNSAQGLLTSAQTEDLQSAINIIKPLVKRTSDLGSQVTGTLTRLIQDPTIPTSELFDQFKSVVEDIKKFITEDSGDILNNIKETFGCVREEQFKNKITDNYNLVLKISGIVRRIGAIVLKKDDARNHVNSAQLQSLVDALSQNIKEFSDAVASFTAVVKSAVDATEKANSFLMSLTTKETTTRNDMNSTATKANGTANTQSMNVENKYEAAQLSMKTDLTNALKGLNIFSSLKKLNNLVEDNKMAYSIFYKFLRSRSESDLADIEEYFGKMGNRTAKTLNQTAEIFIDSVHRTGLRLADVVLEGGSHADSCYNTFNLKFLAPFTSLTTFVSSCVSKETTRLSSIATAVEDLLKLTQMNSQELSSNLGRCSSSYSNFATSSEDYVQAKACLKTNLEDMEELPKVVEPLLKNVNQVVKRETKSSIFRLENCLITNLHEAMAKLKFTRSAIEICAESAGDCPRKDRDDDDKEWHHRERDTEEKEWNSFFEEDELRREKKN